MDRVTHRSTGQKSECLQEIDLEMHAEHREDSQQCQDD